MLYTSGSTGRPKAVMVEHAGIVNRICWMQRRYRLQPGDRVLQKTPYTFDVSVWEFFWPLVVGARLVFAAPGAHRDPQALAATVDRHAVSHLHFVPTVLDAFMTAVGAAPASLRQVFCSGEALRSATARRFAGWSDAALHNLYGPTEASVDVTAHTVDPDHLDTTLPTVPIGRPIDNIRTYLLDDRLRPVPPGVAGQLYLAGIGLARGYLGRPDLTADRFVPDPFDATPGGRLYRTGDQARWRRDGTIEFLGRVDGQVKLHGVRIEPGEIEARLAEHPAVAGTAVVVHEPTGQPAQLVAYVVARPGEAPTTAQLRTHLSERLPAAFVPARYVRLDRLPLTTSGKVDRRALPAPDGEPDEARPHTPPQTPVQHAFVAVWSQVLGRADIGITDDFFALGGDSMRAIRAVGALRNLQIAVSVADMFALRTIAALAAVATVPQQRLDDLAAGPFELVSERERAGLPAGVRDAYPLSQVQAGMLYELITDEQRRPYHNVTVYSIDDGGAFDTAALRAAVVDVVNRHEVLRTSFDLGRYGKPLQLVHERAAAAVAVEDLCGVPADEQREHIRAAALAERARLFDLTVAPTWRLRAFRTSATGWTLAVVECHAILDGWSHNSLLNELLERYRTHRDDAGATPPPAPPQRRYADFVAMERAALEQDGDRGYWADLLERHETVRLPQAWGGDPAGPAVTVVEPLDAELSGRLRQLAATLGVSPKAVFLAAFAKVMSPLAGRPDFLLGLVTNGRPEVSGGDEVLGMYLNTVPLPMRRPVGSWRDLILAAAAAEREVWPHRRYPLPAMRRLVGGAQPLVEAVYNYLDFYLLDGSGVDLADTEDNSPNEFPLQVTVLPGQLVLTAQPERADRDRLTALGRAHRRVLDAMLADLDAPAGHSVLSPAEQQLVLADGSPLDPRLTPATLHGLVAEQTARTPDAVAVCDADTSLSYAELDAAATAFAHRLAGHGCGPDRPVGVLMRRGVELVVAILGILKAGAGYLPLEPQDPPARRAARLAAAGARLLVTDDPTALVDNGNPAEAPDAGTALDAAGEPAEVTVLEPPPLWPGQPGPVADPVTAGPGDLAYLMFTSGSTGGPKGVLIPHAGIANYVQWLSARDWLRPGERMVLKTPYTFDVSVSEIFWPLSTGATLVVAPDELHRDPVALADFLTAQRVGHACFVPSMLDAFLASVDTVPACLTEVYCAGEALRTATVRRLRELSTARVHNMYGPTEASIIGTACVVPDSDAGQGPDVPIGRPVDNTQALVLDAELHPVPDGVPGHLHLGGAGLAYGYAGQPAVTAGQFVPNPYAVVPGGRLYRTGDLARRRPDGTIEYLGRSDNQIKIGGVRIEPAEIESVLLRHPSVRAAVVVARRSGAHTRLIGYVAGDGDGDDLRAHAAAWLPPLLVPATVVVLPDLPLTGSGKVDRRALPDAGPGGTGATFVPPRTAVEQALAQAWEAELGTGPIGVEDGFLDRGGHSLAAMRIAIRLRQEHQLAVSPVQIMVGGTIAALAATLDPTSVAGSAERVDPVAEVNQEPAVPAAAHRRRGVHRGHSGRRHDGMDTSSGLR